MSIVKMNKISIIGLESDRENILKRLMEMGAVEIENIDEKVKDEQWENLLENHDKDSEIPALESNINLFNSAIEILSKYDDAKKGMFDSKRQISVEEYNSIIKNNEEIKENVKELIKLSEKINALKTEENKLKNLINSLEPWETLSIPVEINSTKKTKINIGVIPVQVELEQLKNELNESDNEVIIDVINSDRDQNYIVAIFHTSCEEEVTKILKQFAFSNTAFKNLKGTAKENIDASNNRILEIERQREELEEDSAKFLPKKNDIEVLYDHYVMELDRKKAIDNILKTDKSFYIEGWIPDKASINVSKYLKNEYECYVKIEEPLEEEEYRILLENNILGQAVEPVTEMYSLPDKKEIDPNIVMAPFFILFFGLMFSDAAYGLIMIAISATILIKFKPQDFMNKFTKLILYCGIATTFWGVLFGGWFGNIYALFVPENQVENITEQFSLWFNPGKDPERLLKYSLLFGVIHVFTGIAIKGINLFRQKKYIDIVFDVVFWYILFTGFIFVLLPFVPTMEAYNLDGFVNVGKYMFFIGIILIVLTNGRQQKNPFAKLAIGVVGLYDIIGFLGDILSYSRLLALGLATSVIASIINQMGTMMEMPIVFKIIVFAIIFVLGHAFNFAINALGAYVHSSRLQYIEFFQKFYKGGGKPFKPLKSNTKYISIKN